MPVSVRVTNRGRRKDALDRIAQGLAITNEVLQGVGSFRKNILQDDPQSKLAQGKLDTQERQERGEFTPLEASKAGLAFSTGPAKPGAIPGALLTPEGRQEGTFSRIPSPQEALLPLQVQDLTGKIQERKTKAEEKVQKKEKQKEASVTNAFNVSNDIDSALKLSDESFTVGLGGSIAGLIPGTKASDLDAMLDSIKANIGFSKLKEMRNSSPTGAALGPVSDTENKLLQSVFGSLSRSQSKEQFQKSLNLVRERFLDIVHGGGNWRRLDDGRIFVRAAEGWIQQ